MTRKPPQFSGRTILVVVDGKPVWAELSDDGRAILRPSGEASIPLPLQVEEPARGRWTRGEDR